MTRYTAHDYDAAWQVWDNVERRSVGGSFTEAGALAEAARLNALVPNRAKAVEAWAVKPTPGSKISWQTYPTRAAARQRARDLNDMYGFRCAAAARVRITEIEGGDSHE